MVGAVEPDEQVTIGVDLRKFHRKRCRVVSELSGAEIQTELSVVNFLESRWRMVVNVDFESDAALGGYGEISAELAVFHVDDGRAIFPAAGVDERAGGMLTQTL